MSSSWLAGIVAEKLTNALAWQDARLKGVKYEFDASHFSDNGSNLKVQVNMASGSLHVLKVQGSTLILTDGTVSLPAKFSTATRTQFENQYACRFASIESKSIISQPFAIVATHLGPPASRIQLVVFNLSLSDIPLDPSDIRDIVPFHHVPVVQEFLKRQHEVHKKAEEPAPTTGSAPAVVVTEYTDVDMVEAPFTSEKTAERATPLKRPLPSASPSRSSSHRSVRPRTYNEDDDVMIQTGLNLQQPVQLPSNSPQQRVQLLDALRKTTGVKASTALDQALRLGGVVSAPMAPPPLPTPVNAQVQPFLQPESQSPSQNFESQIPLAESAVSDPVTGDIDMGGTSVPRPGAKVIDQIVQPKTSLPNDTPTSAQPELEPPETTQSSLPRGRVPLPSQSQALAASLGTSSSHLLDDISSGAPRPLHRAPPPLFIKYARRPIPNPQRKLLDKPTSWWPSRPGTTFPHPNIPIEILNRIEEITERREAKGKARVREQTPQRQQQTKAGQDVLVGDPHVTQGTQSSAYSWESSPPEHRQPRNRMDAVRRSTNLLPPDSSAGEPMQMDDPIERIPSSPPSGSLSEASEHSDVEEYATPKPTPRQLPSFPLSSPEEEQDEPSMANPEPGPHVVQPPEFVQDNTTTDEPQPDGEITRVMLSDPEDILSQSNGGGTAEEAPTMSLLPGDEDPPDLQVPTQAPASITLYESTTMNNRVQIDNIPMVDDQAQIDDAAVKKDHDDTAMNAGLGVQKDMEMNDEPEIEVAASPRPHPRKRRRQSWGLEESRETTRDMQARLKREFIEQKRKNEALLRSNEVQNNTVGVQATSQIREEVSEKPEPDFDTRAPDLASEAEAMDVDEPLLEPANLAESGAAKRASIIEAWRQKSDQEEGETEAGALAGETLEPASAQSNVAAPVSHEPVSLESVVLEPAIPATTVSEVRPRSEGALTGAMRDLSSTQRGLQITHSPAGSSGNKVGEKLPTDSPDSRSRPGLSMGHSNTSTPKSKQVLTDKQMLINRKWITRGKFDAPSTALWVGSLPADFNDPKLRDLFSEFNPTSVAAKTEFGFVNFADVDTACSALEARHGLILNGKKIKCNFGRASTGRNQVAPNPVPPAPLPALEDLYHEMCEKRNYKGNRTAFEKYCKILHKSSNIPFGFWDDYVVLQPARFLPYANRSISNGDDPVDYDTYWRETLQQDVTPELFPVLTPAKLEAVFNKRPIPPQALRPSAHQPPQTIPGAHRSVPPLIQQTPSSASPTSRPAPASASRDLRRSVVERRAQTATDLPRPIITQQPEWLLNIPEPDRTSKWLLHNFVGDKQACMVQSHLFELYKTSFSVKGCDEPLMQGGLFIPEIGKTFPTHTIKRPNEKGEDVFYIYGVRAKRLSPRGSDGGSPSEFKIKGISASSPVEGRSRIEMPSSTHPSRRELIAASASDRDGRSRRSLPFNEQRQSRSRSPPRMPTMPAMPKGVPKGKPSSRGPVEIREVSHFSFFGWSSLLNVVSSLILTFLKTGPRRRF
ncbi:hypothetical protein E4T47_07790 [Aureobasidium subglaciale]|nr:hypothetical protein E4T47_07790 [Aureobasidium subglaciale]